jgi:GntR family transcriptional regulator, rspAB operon transcriptional repressor
MRRSGIGPAFGSSREFTALVDAPALQLQLVNLDRKSPLRDQIYQLIRTLVIIGQLRPGQPVNEVDIAEQLGVSRTPVREAVKRLSDEGLINVVAQSGTFITDISRRDLEEAYIIRNALELESVRRAAGAIEKRHVDELDDNIRAHQQAIGRKRYAEAIRLDDQFHRAIAEINGLSMLWRAVDISKAQMDRGRYLSIPLPGWGEVTINQHRAVLDALSRHDGDSAVAAMREHLDTSLQNTLSLLDEPG